MKKYLTSAVLIVMAATAIAAPQTYTAPIKPKRPVKKTTPPPVQKEEVRGVLARAFAPGNNPLQMVNPKAPAAKYGTSQQHVALDPNTGKPMGIKLFEFIF